MSFRIKQNSSPGWYLGKFDSILLINYRYAEIRRFRSTDTDYQACLCEFSVQLKFLGFTVPCILLTPFCTDDEAGLLRNTELHPRWAAPSDLRHLGLKRDVETTLRCCHGVRL